MAISSDQPFEFKLVALSERYAPDDERWYAEQNVLYEALREETGAVRRQVTPAPGSKGLAESVIIALGSAGAFQAAAQCWRDWLSRDRSRSLRLSWNLDGREGEVVVDATGIDGDEFAAIVDLARQRLGGAA